MGLDGANDVEERSFSADYFIANVWDQCSILYSYISQVNMLCINNACANEVTGKYQQNSTKIDCKQHGISLLFISSYRSYIQLLFEVTLQHTCVKRIKMSVQALSNDFCGVVANIHEKLLFKTRTTNIYYIAISNRSLSFSEN